MRDIPHRFNGRLLTIVVVSSVIALTIVLGAAWYAAGVRSRDLCQVANENRTVLRDVLLLFQERSSDLQADFWIEALSKVEPVTCE